MTFVSKSRTLWRYFAGARLRRRLRPLLLEAMQPGSTGSPQPANVAFRPYTDAEPLIVIGSHRSGTSLATQVLEQMGFFAGATVLKPLREAVFFLELNRVLMLNVGAAWHTTEAMNDALATPAWVQGAAQWLLDECRSPSQWLYVGKQAWLRGERLPLARPWGWKDPRSTWLLAVWLLVFPRARVLHVYRNGVDVSQSLVARQARQLRSHRSAGAVTRCMTLTGAFKVWDEYTRKAEEVLGLVDPARKMTLRYEDLLEAPREWAAQLADFAGLQPNAQQMDQVQATVRGDRAFAFAAKPELYAFYRTVQHHPLMQQYGYGAIEPASPSASPHDEKG